MTDKQRAELLQRAAEAAKNAYAPYSGTERAAALMADDGSIYVGTNVEFATYNGSLCAEMVALSAAVAAGKRKFTAMAVFPYGWPCGCCRQGLSEFGTELVVLTQKPNSEPEAAKLSSLLPYTFGKAHLG